jgi:dTDP-4-dehydrorhamnose reductase
MNKILILGGSGMLGHKLWQVLGQKYETWITLRRGHPKLENLMKNNMKIRQHVDALDIDSITRAVAAIQPNLVINCIGLIKQLREASDPLSAITINSQLPHRVSLICKAAGIKMIHISTDCVYSGGKGSYLESDVSDAKDLYGASKKLGEVEYPHTITLRTSIIGHEIRGCRGLLDWFLKQDNEVAGYTKAIFSGLTTLELSNVIKDYVIPNRELSGLYHVSSDPISKYDLLSLVNNVYQKNIKINKCKDVVLDRSLDSSNFRNRTGYKPVAWEKQIEDSFCDYNNNIELYRGITQ